MKPSYVPGVFLAIKLPLRISSLEYCETVLFNAFKYTKTAL